LSKTGSPTGSGYAKVYAHSGTYGTSSVPTGSALATSDAYDISNLTTEFQTITFSFTGDDRIYLTHEGYYFVSFEYGGGSGDVVSIDGTAYSDSHDGNTAYDFDPWLEDDSIDTVFYVYGEVDPPVVGEKYPLPAYKNS
jgi:hypothetical protein